MASASAASSLSNLARGRSTRTIARICGFSAWPAPTIVFLTAFGAYSATRQPRARRNQQRDAPRLAELQRRGRVAVDEGLLDRRLVGLRRRGPLAQPVMDATSRAASSPSSGARTVPAATKASALPVMARRRPSRCGGGRDRCRGCESRAHAGDTERSRLRLNRPSLRRGAPPAKRSGRNARSTRSTRT